MVHTDLVCEGGEDGAPGAACEPQHERVVGRAALGVDEVVEEANAIAFVHLHVPDAHIYTPDRRGRTEAFMQT